MKIKRAFKKLNELDKAVGGIEWSIQCNRRIDEVTYNCRIDLYWEPEIRPFWSGWFYTLDAAIIDAVNLVNAYYHFDLIGE